MPKTPKSRAAHIFRFHIRKTKGIPHEDKNVTQKVAQFLIKTQRVRGKHLVPFSFFLKGDKTVEPKVPFCAFGFTSNHRRSRKVGLFITLKNHELQIIFFQNKMSHSVQKATAVHFRLKETIFRTENKPVTSQIYASLDAQVEKNP